MSCKKGERKPVQGRGEQKGLRRKEPRFCLRERGGFIYPSAFFFFFHLLLSSLYLHSPYLQASPPCLPRPPFLNGTKLYGFYRTISQVLLTGCIYIYFFLSMSDSSLAFCCFPFYILSSLSDVYLYFIFLIVLIIHYI